jgi:HlyD family secretion protein
MKNRLIFVVAGSGVLVGLLSAYIYGRETPPQPPAFEPAANPYARGIYAQGIIESDQDSGENINLYPEVAGVVTRVLVVEGQQVSQGQPLFALDDTVQRATAEQQRAQAEAALALLQELKAQPRPESLAVASSQVDLAAAQLKTAQDSYDKQNASYQLNARSVSKDALDTARNNAEAARTGLEVARRQYQLVHAGAWSYDIRNQESQYQASSKAYAAAQALLDKYTVRAPADGVVLSIAAAVGGYISPAQGTYETYTQGQAPAVVMGQARDALQVRCYVDEILVQRMPAAAAIKAQMSVRGTDVRVPLQFVRIQPYVSPKIELSNQRTERVDVRVLPVIFRFTRPKGVELYPGQQVDVYVGEG